MNAIEIEPAPGALDASIRPPGSKSITNRALVCAAAAEGSSQLNGVLRSEDTEVMLAALAALGVTVEEQASEAFRIAGCGGRFRSPSDDLFVANSGTTIRFLTALLAAAGGTYRLDGIARMRERPIGDLLAAIQQQGVDAESVAGTGCPPVQLRSNGFSGGRVTVRGDISSQYLSGLLMAAPLAKEAIEIVVDGPLVSKPYVAMTIRVMESFGAKVQSNDLQRFEISPSGYRGVDYSIEPDASAASYFWGAAAICGGRVQVDGLSRNSLQGDVRFCECLEQMGCEVEYGDRHVAVRRRGPLRGIDVDMNAISDTVQTLAAVALYAEGPTRVRGVAHNRHKETDRIGDLARELRKVGATVDEHEDGLTIDPAVVTPAELDTYNDHRMAMSLALIGLRTSGIVIRDPECTVKTYPHYFEDFRRVTAG